MREIITIADPELIKVDLFIGCIGFEHRSIEALRTCAQARNAGLHFLFDYNSQAEHCYLVNSREVELIDCVRFTEFSLLRQSVELHLRKNRNTTVQIDITSLDRKKIAILAELLFDNAESINCVLLTYFPRQFVEPSPTLEEVLEFGPVTPRFVGSASYERESLSLIVGAGYEFGRVIGAIDVLEPEVTFCMSPVGTDPRFERAVAKNNLDFGFLDDPTLLINYNVLDPYSTYSSLRRLVQAELAERNVLLLPLGPKIFAALSLLVALIYAPSVMVWRYSTVDPRRPASLTDARASGECARFAFSFAEM